MTCVPSDSPDDYITSLDLAKKAEYYKIDPSWIAFDPVPVLSTPTYGDLTAPALVDKFKIQSPKDVKQLAEAKEIAYKEGFYQGTMVIGEYKGLKVEEAKTKVREDMIKGEVAFAYSEPENLVMSRSADECIVALCDQWYLDYGETGWRIKAELYVARASRDVVADRGQTTLAHAHVQSGDAQRLRADAWLATTVGVREELRSRVQAPVGPAVPRRVPLGFDHLHGVLHRCAFATRFVVLPPLRAY